MADLQIINPTCCCCCCCCGGTGGGEPGRIIPFMCERPRILLIVPLPVRLSSMCAASTSSGALSWKDSEVWCVEEGERSLGEACLMGMSGGRAEGGVCTPYAVFVTSSMMSRVMRRFFSGVTKSKTIQQATKIDIPRHIKQKVLRHTLLYTWTHLTWTGAGHGSRCAVSTLKHRLSQPSLHTEQKKCKPGLHIDSIKYYY